VSAYQVALQYAEKLLKHLESIADDPNRTAVAGLARDFMNRLVVAESAREKAAELKTRHDALVVECRAARDAVERAGIDVDHATRAWQTAWSRMEDAESKLGEFLRRPHDPFTTEAEKVEAAKQHKGLQAALEVARGKVRETNERRHELHREQREAAKRFESLCFQERNSRPPGEQPPDFSIGRNGLSAVSGEFIHGSVNRVVL